MCIRDRYIGQLNLISLWGAVSRGSAIVRLPWALFLTTLMWGSLVFGHSVLVDRNLTSTAVRNSNLVIGGSLGFGCLATQLPLWIASRFFGWRLVADEGSDEQRDQFDLKQMLLGTLLLAGALAVCQGLIGEVELKNFLSVGRQLWVLMAFLIPMAIFNLVFVIPAIWAVFLVKMDLRRLSIAVLLLALVGPVEFLAIVAILGNGPSVDDYPNWLAAFSAMHLAQVFVVFGSMAVLKRAAGFRLIRIANR